MAEIRSPAWGGESFPIFQDFGTVSEDTAHMYPAEYTEPLGHPAGTHVGLDIGMDRGTKIYALNGGEVIKAGFDPNNFRPKPVWVETTDNPDTLVDESGYVEIYGHLWENTVATGDTVKPGQPLGLSGEQTVRGTMTPDGTGPHLHFELRQPGANTSSGYKAIDPRQWLRGTFDVLIPDDSETGSTGDDSGPQSDGIFDIGGITDAIKSASQRGAFVVVGVVILALGLNAVLKSSGFSAGKAVRKTVKRAVPAARLAKALS